MSDSDSYQYAINMIIKACAARPWIPVRERLPRNGTISENMQTFLALTRDRRCVIATGEALNKMDIFLYWAEIQLPAEEEAKVGKEADNG